MTLFEQITQSPEALAKWWNKMVDCDGCPFTNDCRCLAYCASNILRKLNEEVE